MIDEKSVLPRENQELIRANALKDQTELQNKIIETGWRLTQHNFITNAGGAVAILGFLGTESAGSWAIIPLLIFALGIISSTVEIRALLATYSVASKARSFRFGLALTFPGPGRNSG